MQASESAVGRRRRRIPPGVAGPRPRCPRARSGIEGVDVLVRKEDLGVVSVTLDDPLFPTRDTAAWRLALRCSPLICRDGRRTTLPAACRCPGPATLARAARLAESVMLIVHVEARADQDRECRSPSDTPARPLRPRVSATGSYTAAAATSSGMVSRFTLAYCRVDPAPAAARSRTPAGLLSPRASGVAEPCETRSPGSSRRRPGTCRGRRRQVLVFVVSRRTSPCSPHGRGLGVRSGGRSRRRFGAARPSTGLADHNGAAVLSRPRFDTRRGRPRPPSRHRPGGASRAGGDVGALRAEAPASGDAASSPEPRCAASLACARACRGRRPDGAGGASPLALRRR